MKSDTNEDVESQLKSFTEELAEGLPQDVFNNNDRCIIQHCQVITNLKAPLAAVREEGHLKVAATGYREFIDAIHALPLRSLGEVSDECLQKQFIELVGWINQFLPASTALETINAKYLIKKLLESKEEH